MISDILGKLSVSAKGRILAITRTDKDGGWDSWLYLAARAYLPTATTYYSHRPSALITDLMMSVPLMIPRKASFIRPLGPTFMSGNVIMIVARNIFLREKSKFKPVV